MQQPLLEHIEMITKVDKRYAAEAYSFVMEALSYTQKKLSRERHVSGVELLEGIRTFAVNQYGFLALTILHKWGVKSTEDIGHIVFNLVDYGILCKQEEDTFESFRNGFDFEQAFQADYQRQLKRAVRRIR